MTAIAIILLFANIVLILLYIQKEQKIISFFVEWMKSETLKNKAEWENWNRIKVAYDVYVEICKIITEKYKDYEPCVMFRFVEASMRKILFATESGIDWNVVTNNLRARYKKNKIEIRAVEHNGMLTVTFL